MNQFSSWLLGDHLGSTSMVADASGAVVSEVRYSVFGEIRYQNGTLTTDYLYTGQRQEAEIGLYYFVARWYDPAIGRFIQADSIVPNPMNVKGFDRYAYGFNNPLLYLDPSGHAPLLLDGMQIVYQDFSYSSHVSTSTVDNTNNWHEKPDKNVKFPDKNYNHNDDEVHNSDPFQDVADDKNTTEEELTDAEKLGLITTGILLVPTFTAAEISLGLLGIAALDFGPAGAVFDVLVVAPIELFLIDAEVGVIRFIEKSVTTGYKPERVELILFSFLQNNSEKED